MGTDEVVREAIEFQSRDPGLNPWTDLNQKIGDDGAAACNHVDLVRSLQVYHGSINPKASRTSRWTSSTPWSLWTW